MRRLIGADGKCTEPSIEEVRREVAAEGSRFWLDIERPEDADYALLLDDFKFHPLTVEDVRQQNQRPKMDEFPGYLFAVLFTAERKGDDLEFHEQHLYLAGGRMVSIHQEPTRALTDLIGRLDADPELARGDSEFLHYLVVNAVVECLYPVLDDLDDTIDTLEDGILVRVLPNTLQRITDLKHAVSDLRRVVAPQREVFQRLIAHNAHRERDEITIYWRDVYEHLVRQHEQVDSLRDLLSGVMDVYLSTVSNRLNDTMKQLTVIASLLLPLTFITGFFGMNFGTLIGVISTRQAFVSGLALMAASIVLQLVLFRRRGWI